MSSLKLKLTFRLDCNKEIDTRRVGENLQQTLMYWNDGRYPLMTEVIHNALVRLCEGAIFESVQDEIEEKEGIIFVSPRGRIVKDLRRAKSYTRQSLSKTEKKLHDLRVHIYGEATASLTDTDTSNK